MAAIHQIVLLGGFALIFAQMLQRPRDYYRLARHATRAMAPAWAILVLGVAATVVLFPAGPGLWRFLGERAFPDAVELLIAQAALIAGSVWVWRGGLRGKRLGWLARTRDLPRMIAWKPFLLAAAAANGITALIQFFPPVPITPDPHFQAEFDAGMRIGARAFEALVWTHLLIAPFFEEAFYRHFLQSAFVAWLEKRGAHWMIGCAAVSALWAVGHAGIVAPGWVKFVQIFAIGLIFGWLQKRWGVATAIAAHLSFNVCVIFYSG